jgi:hypothetical protein
MSASVFMVNKKPYEKLVFRIEAIFVVGAAGAAAVRLDPRFRINETDKVSERRVYFLILYIFWLKKNPTILRRFHSRHLTPKSQ